MECSTQHDKEAEQSERDACQKIPTKVCLICRVINERDPTFFCNTCWEVAHSNRHTRKHAYVSAKTYFDLMEEDNFHASDEDHELDEKNKLCLVTDNGQFAPGPKFLNLPVDRDSCMSVVSFIAPSGSGKSRLLRTLVDEPKPLHSTPGSTEPCSSDIHAYLGVKRIIAATSTRKCNIDDDKDAAADDDGDNDDNDAATAAADDDTCETVPILFLDSEGTGAQKGTLESKKHQRIVTFLGSNLEERREMFVEKVFPRILYMFSDLICVPCKASHSAHLSIIEPLILFAESAAARTINQAVRPYLIIVANNIPTVESVPNGNWDVNSTTNSFLRTSSGEKKKGVAKLLKFFQDVKVLYVPNSKTLPIQYLQQVSRLQDLVLEFVMKSRSQKRRLNFQLEKALWCSMVYRAIYILDKKPLAPINLQRLLGISRGKNDVDYMIESYHKIVECHVENSQEKSPDTEKIDLYRTALREAAEHFQIHALQLILFNSKTNGVYVPPSTGKDAMLTPEQEELLLTFGEKVQKVQICTAESFFKDSVADEEKEVTCETSMEYHSDFHKSAKTYRRVVDRSNPNWFQRWFSLKMTLETPCQWEGEFKAETDYRTSFRDAALKQLQLLSPESLPCDDIHSYLASVVPEYCRNTFISTVCLVCTMHFPTEQYSCGHSICGSCAQQVQNSEFKKCPFCLKPFEWTQSSVSRKAGIRILSLDGGGFRAIVELLILQEIEQRTDFAVFELFDLVTGTSGGGIVALGLCVKTDSGIPLTTSTLLERMRCLGENVNVRRRLSTFLAHRKLRRTDKLRRDLENVFGDGRLDSIAVSTRVCLSCCTIETGEAKTTLIASYNRPNSPNLPAIVSSMRISFAGCASIAAPGYLLPVYSKRTFKLFVDGGLTQNCTAALAHTEYTRLWPGQNLDLLLSLGCSGCNEEERYHLLGTDVSNTRKTVEETVSEISKKLKNKFVRMDPPLSRQYPWCIGEEKIYSQLVYEVKQWIQSNPVVIEQLCNNLLSKLFYLDLQDSFGSKALLKAIVRPRNDSKKLLSLAALESEWSIYWSDSPDHFKMVYELGFPVFIGEFSAMPPSMNVTVYFRNSPISGMPALLMEE